MYLANNHQLNDFLANGNHELFITIKQESMYKLPTFVDFVSPYFAAKLGIVLQKTFKSHYLDLFKSALRTEFLLNQSDLTIAYRGLSNELQERIREIDKITDSINEEESDYTEDDIEEVIDIVKDYFPIELLNALPIYFQSQINKIAGSINYLMLAILNEYDITSVPLALLEHLLKLNIESVSKPTYEKNYRLVKEQHKEHLEQEKTAPILKVWAKILLSIQSKVKEIEGEGLQANIAYKFVKEYLDISELNRLPAFANEIRTQIGYSIRSLAIACWNEKNDMNSALSLIHLYSLFSCSRFR